MAIKISKNRVDMGSTPIKNVQYQDLDQITTPAAPATGKTRFYSKTDGSLYVVPAAGSETAVSSSIPSNLIAHTTATAAPTGWTEFTAGRGRVIVGTPLSGTHAGTVGSALTDLQNPTHTHTYTDVVAHIHTVPNRAVGSYTSYISGDANYTDKTNDTNSTGSASGTTATATALPPYIQQLGIIKS